MPGRTPPPQAAAAAHRPQSRAARLVLALMTLRSTGLAGWGLSLGLFGAALWMRFALDASLPPGFPFLTFFPAIVLSAFLCGRGPALLCVALSVGSAWYWFIPPRGSFGLDGPSTVAVLFFLGISLLDVFVIEMMTNAMGRLASVEHETRALLEQRTVLYRELQHRVANTLTLVGTVLSAQQRALAGNPEAVQSLVEVRRRFELMSRLHRHLYDPSAMVQPLEPFLRGICEDFLSAQGREDILVRVQADPAPMDLDRRVTLALLILELVTNAVKHAFDDSGGELDVQLRSQGGDEVELRVADNGRGLPAGFDPTASERLGMRIAHGLARSLRGELHYDTVAAGTAAVVRFRALDDLAAP